MNELIIDGKRVDLGDETKVGLTFQVNDIAELKDRQGNFTNTFKTPKTKNNKEIYGHVETVVSNTDKPYKKLSAKYLEDGIEIVPNGFIEFDSAGESYEQTIYSGITDFFTLIKGKTLGDLDLSSEDHVWDLPTIFNSRNKTTGYIYPLIDWSSDTEDNPAPYMGIVSRDIDVRTLFVAIFIHDLVTRIFAQTPYKAVGNILSDTEYLNDLFPFQLNNLKYPDSLITSALFLAYHRLSGTNTVYYSGTTNYDANFLPSGYYQNLFITPVPFLNDYTQGGYDNGNNFVVAYYTVPFSGTYNFHFDFDYQFTVNDYFVDHVNFTVEVFRQRLATISSIYVATKTTTVVAGAGALVSFTENFQNNVLQNFKNGDRIWCEVKVVFFMSRINVNQNSLTVLSSSKSYCDFNNGIAFGADVFMSTMMPNISQETLLKTVAQIYGITFIPDNVNKIIYFKQYKELYANKSIAKNMSSKIDVSKKIKVKTRFGSYAQKNWIKWKEDKTNLTTGLGDGAFNISDETLELEKDLFTLAFAATEDVTRLIGLRVCNIGKLTLGVMKNNTEPRIIRLNRQNITGGAITYDFFGNPGSSLSSSADIPLTYFIDTANSRGLGFFQYLFSKHYMEFIRYMLDKPKEIELYFKLSTIDVINFDHFIPWYLSQYSNDFYVNSIENYQKNKVTKVQLVRM